MVVFFLVQFFVLVVLSFCFNVLSGFDSDFFMCLFELDQGPFLGVAWVFYVVLAVLGLRLGAAWIAWTIGLPPKNAVFFWWLFG